MNDKNSNAQYQDFEKPPKQRSRRKRLIWILSIIAVTAVSVFLIVDFRSPEARAEDHYQSALALLEEGDTARADIELRNVFDLDGQHREARSLFAQLQYDQGNYREAFSQYLLLSEQYPEALEPRLKLAEMSFDASDWPSFERHAEMAASLAPENPLTQIYKNALDYREAVIDTNNSVIEDAARQTNALLNEYPDSYVGNQIFIDYLARQNRYQDALPYIDRLIDLRPDQIGPYQTKLQTLAATGDTGNAEPVIEAMISRFPQSEQVRQIVISWYLAVNDLDAAEAVMREYAANAPEDEQAEANLTIVRFIRETQGMAPARIALQEIIENNSDASAEAQLQYDSALAELNFDLGNRQQALDSFDALLSDIADDDVSANNSRIAYARALNTTGNPVGARAQIETVLETDPSNAVALNMLGRWQLEEENYDAAIQTLRQALNQNARDVDALTLLASAYLATGNEALAGEQLSRAVEATGNASAPEVLRYVEFLTQTGSRDVAISVLTDALRLNPNDINLNAQIALLYIENGDAFRVQQTINRLRNINRPRATEFADRLEDRLTQTQNGIANNGATLRSFVNNSGGEANTVLAIVQNLVAQDNIEQAVDYVESRLSETPDDVDLKLIMAQLDLFRENFTDAESRYRALVTENAQNIDAVTGLYNVLNRQNKVSEAEDTLLQGLEDNPGSLEILLRLSGHYENQGDIGRAIETVETAYAENGENLVVINNLASLLSTQREDTESLERAANMVAPLTEIDVPAFRDTYGWIQYRLGNYDMALDYLEAAAEGLGDDARVQYHLGALYVALGRADDATAQLDTAEALATAENNTDVLNRIAEAREANTAS